MTRRARISIGLWLAFLAMGAVIAAKSRYTADLSAFLPRSPTPAQRVLVEQLRDGVVSQFILIGLENAPQERLARLSDALTDRLQSDASFAYANNGADKRVEKDGEFLLRNRYALSPGVTPERFTAEGLRSALGEDLDLLASPLSTLVGGLLPADPTGEFLRLLELLQLEGGPQKQHGVWFSTDGKRALVIAQTRAGGFDIDEQERALQRLRALFDAVVNESSGGDARLVFSGPGVFAVAARAGIKEDVTRISALALVMVCALLLLVYRSPRVLGLTLLPVLTGTVAGVAAVSLAFGSVHGVTLGFGATLLGEGVDYAIYLFTNAGAGGLADSGRERLWRTLRLGLLTSVCGFGVLLFSDFSGLAQLGLFSIVGLIVAYAVTRHVLPDLAPAAYQAQPVAAIGPGVLRLVQRAHALRYVLVALLVVCVAWLAYRGGGVWDDRLESLSPVAEADKQLDAQLRADLGAPDARYLVVATLPSEQAALQAAERAGAALERLRSSGALEGFDSPALMLPSQATQQLRKQALPAADALRTNLSEAAQGLPFRIELFEPFFSDAAAAKSAPPIVRADLHGTGLKVKLDTLLSERGSVWVALLPLRGVNDPRAVAAAVQALELPSVQLLDFKREADGMYRGYRRQAGLFALFGAVAIALLLLLSLGSLRRTWDVLAPLGAALIVTAAVLTARGGNLTMFHLVGMLLVVGVGSNYSLFFERRALASGDARRTVAALVLCNASTVIGFGLLAWARVPVLSAIGSTVALGAFLSLAFSAILFRGRPEALAQ